jgi:hypothetical protein
MSGVFWVFQPFLRPLLLKKLFSIWRTCKGWGGKPAKRIPDRRQSR